jgi:multicomponent K+:H+ antiporter subunit G
MTNIDQVPAVIVSIVATLACLGALMALIGSIGLLRLRTFYERVHPPTMGTTMGVAFIIAASILLFSVLDARPVVHELLIGIFAVVTTPVTYLMLVRAALRRDRARDKTASEIVLSDRDSNVSDDGVRRIS